MITRITHTTVPVTDQDRALAFYRDVLGFDVIEDNKDLVPGFRWLTVAPKGSEVSIVLHKPTPDTPEGAFKAGTWTGMVLLTDDLDGDYERMKSKGVTFTAEPRDEAWGTEAQFADPDGNMFELVERRL